MVGNASLIPGLQTDHKHLSIERLNSVRMCNLVITI